MIFHAGDPGDSLFVVDWGVVKVSLPAEDGDEAILSMHRRGDLFGVLTLLDGEPRQVTAVAMEPTQVLLVGRERFLRSLSEAPTRDALVAGLVGDVRGLITRIEELHFLDIAGRLAARLVDLAKQAGTELSDGSLRLDLPLTQRDLASMVGCTRQSVNKLLGQFADDGMVRLDRDNVVITDLARLVRYARR